MKHSPLVSIVMPNYNCEKYISQAINSILRQTFRDFELIIVDDGSTDSSWEIIRRFAQEDSRIVAMRNDNNIKICKTLNRGILIAQGKYIARMDSDDVAHADWLEKIMLFMEAKENAHVGVCGANFYMIDHNAKRIGQKDFPHTDRECRDAFWFRNPFAHNTVVIRKECFEHCGYYDEEYLYAEDLELWMRFGQKYDLHNIQQYLVDYRIFGGNSILKKQKMMIRNTLKARKAARDKYHYTMTIKGRIFYCGTWMMQFMPAGFVLWMFNIINKRS